MEGWQRDFLIGVRKVKQPDHASLSASNDIEPRVQFAAYNALPQLLGATSPGTPNGRVSQSDTLGPHGSAPPVPGNEFGMCCDTSRRDSRQESSGAPAGGPVSHQIWIPS